MAALVRATKANYVVHDRITADTSDREDHTFCGVMFPIRAKAVLPVDHIVVTGLSVRGALGPLTVWVTKDEDHAGEIPMSKRRWKKIYSKTHSESYLNYEDLDLSANPIMLKPGNVRGIYIHSTLQGDEAIVYDNQHQRTSHDDGFVTILPGRAHISTKAFSNTPIWGWGNAWRDNREFVGRITYGAVYRLWNPCEHLSFGPEFRAGAHTLLMCQRRSESPVSKLPDDCVYYVLNMCRWDWFNDNAEGMGRWGKVRRRADRRRARIADEESARAMEEGEGVAEEGEIGGGAGSSDSALDSTSTILRDFEQYKDSLAERRAATRGTMDGGVVNRRPNVRPVYEGAVDGTDTDSGDDYSEDDSDSDDSDESIVSFLGNLGRGNEVDEDDSSSNSNDSGASVSSDSAIDDILAYDVDVSDNDDSLSVEDDDQSSSEEDDDTSTSVNGNDDEVDGEIGGRFRRIYEVQEWVRRAEDHRAVQRHATVRENEIISNNREVDESSRERYRRRLHFRYGLADAVFPAGEDDDDSVG